ncbi:2'-5' RNA ligase family protein [Streptomyces syringium]|uniref:2'-5' RNA ligase family protein n=1 Tax=Streptomyces syringium TaxID=76729 RepID=UPI00340A0986
MPELAIERGAFPAAPPADTGDPRVIVEHDWGAFASVKRMANHWDRPGWSDGRRTYYWLLTFPSSPLLADRAQDCQRQLKHLDMDMIPPDGLHVTMARIGHTAQVPRATVDRLARMTAELRLEAFSISAHPLAGSRGAVRFSLTPWTPLIRLHAALTAVGHAAGVPGGKPTAGFRPHLGVGYSNRDQDARPVIDTVAQLRTLPPVPLEVTAVDLVELRRQGTVYRWDVVTSVPLHTASTKSAD